MILERDFNRKWEGKLKLQNSNPKIQGPSTFNLQGLAPVVVRLTASPSTINSFFN
jgi:hypothetical protein